ncbi:MAG: ester cyclase family protein [Chitinophagales bacterium]|nr:ester cyclase family protein [Chitinophagales bacterium]
MKTQLAICTAFILFVFISCNNQQQATTQAPVPTSEEVNKKSYLEIVKAFETGVTDSLGKYVKENSINHGTPPPGITTTGLQGLKDRIAMYRASFPDMKMTFHHVVADGDMLMAHATWSGTNSGPFMGGPSTGKTVASEFVYILRFENGKTAEHWEVEDNLGFMIQMGLIPPQGDAPAPANHPTYDWNATVANDSAKEVQMKASYTAMMAMIQAGDLSTLDQYLDADFKEHMKVPGVAVADGIEGAKQIMAMWKQAYPDLKVTINKVAAEGDMLIAYFTSEGTFAGGIPGLPAEAIGKKVKADGIDIIRFNAEGKAAEHWDLTDHYTEMIQLGLLPDPAASAQRTAN